MRLKVFLLLLPLLLACVPASFAAQYAITTSLTSGGSVSPLKGKNLVDQNGSLDVTYTASEGFYLAQVLVDKLPVTLTDHQSFTYSFTNVQKPHAIAAKFAKNPVIAAKGSKGGTVTPSGNISVSYGSSMAFSFAPDQGYHLASVLVDRGSVGTPESYTFDNVTAKRSLSVLFAINTYDVTTSAGPGGFIAPAGFTAVKHGQSKVFTIKPDSGMRVATLTVNGQPVTDLPASGPYKLTLTITDETAIAATFSEIVLSGTQKLSGTYQIVYDENSFNQNPGGVSTATAASKIVATFDGNGVCKITQSGSDFTTSNQNGNQTVVINTNGSPTSCSYTVDDSNMFTLTLGSPDGTDTVTGWVSADGTVIVTGGPEQSGGSGWHDYRASTVTGVKSGSGMGKSAVAGTYHLVSRDTTLWKSAPQQDGKTYVSDNYYANNVTATFDAAGGCSVSMNGAEFNKNNNGNGEFVTPSTESQTVTSCSYTLGSTGQLTLKLTDPSGTETVTGWLSADGNAFVNGGPELKTDNGGTGYIANHTFGVKAGSGMTVAAVNGTYKLVGSDFAFDQSMFNGISTVRQNIHGNKVTAIFDGAGNCTVNYQGESYNSTLVNNVAAVQVDPENGTQTCTYTVQPDGVFAITLGGTETNTGWVSADGTTLLLGGPSTKTNNGNTHYEVTLMTGVRVK
jgi:hypothetical protein